MLFIHSAFGAGPESIKPKASKEQYGAVNVAEDDVLKKLLSVQGVDGLYKTCKTNHSVDLDKIPSCIWEGLSDDQKKQVKEVYAQEETAQKNKNKGNGRSIASEPTSDAFKTNMTGRKLTVGIDYSTDPSVKALSDFFGKKLEEVLQGSTKDPNDKSIKTVDQSKFIELYTSELGKSIINSFTSYCMEADPSCRTSSSLCLSSSTERTRNDYIKANLQAVNSAKFSKDEGDPWLKCIKDVTTVCYEKSSSTDADEKYSNQKACLIVDFVKAARKNLLAADEQKKFYDSLKGTGTGIASNMQVVDNQKNATADKLTEITSADIDKDFKGKNNKTENIAQANEQTIKEIDECTKGQGITDETKCKKFLDTNTDQNTAAVTDFGLRQMAKSDELDEKLKDDKNVESYLKEEGFNGDQIAEMMKKDKIDEVKAEIKKRFASEKQAVIREMADRIKSKTSTEEGKITKDDTGKIGDIKKELSTRNEDFKNLIHFNNIVSSYLTIQDGKDDDPNKKITRNTASLMAEVNSMTGEEAKTMKENVQKNKELDGHENTAALDVKTINENFLNYSATPIPKPKAP